MRRPPIACQRAVQSLQSPALQHIWVPDEVLSLAVNRFFHSTCQQQKRHGSNVPGPLEARRRATKRRMTASAGFYPQESFPTSFSLEALFGYRSKPQNSWRYEPPSLPKDTPLLDISSPTWNDHSCEVRPEYSATEVSSIGYGVPRSLAPQPTIRLGTYDKPIDLEAVDQRPPKVKAAKHTLIDIKELGQCLESFKAALAVTKDDRSGFVLQEAFRNHLPPASFVWKYYAEVLEHVLRLGRNPGPVLRCLLQEDGRLLRVAHPLHALDDCAKFMDQLDFVSQTFLVRQIFAVIALLATQARRSTTEAHDHILLHLIQRSGHQIRNTGSKEPVWPTKLLYALASQLRTSAENRVLLSHFGSTNRVKSAILSTIHNVATAPGDFASAERALFYMPRQQLLKLVPDITSRLVSSTRGQQYSAELSNAHCLDIWLRLLRQVDVKTNTDQVLLSAAMVSLAKGLRRYDKKSVITPDYFVKALLLHQDIDVQVPSTTIEPRRVQALFADVLLQIQTQAKRYAALLDLALPLVAKHAGLSILLRFIRTMEEQKLPLATQMDFDSIIADELAILSSSTADLSESQMQIRAFALQACEKLANVLSRMGHALPARMEQVATLSGVRQFDNVLIHARANNALPIAYRDVTTDLSLMERVALAHQLAHHYSQDTTRTQREVWRSIYYLYKYLQSNSLPIGPLFTKAIVHASITRPLIESRFVSARRLIWVCHLVARVEGDEVAARVENRFYTWRGDLIGRAKRVFVGVGGSKQSKAHVGTMKRLGLI